MQSLKTKGNDNLLGLRLLQISASHTHTKQWPSEQFRCFASLHYRENCIYRLHSTEKHLKSFRVDSVPATAAASCIGTTAAEGAERF